MSWPAVPLSELTSLITKGTTPTTLGYQFTEGGIPFLRVQNLKGSRVDLDSDQLYISEVTHKALSRSKILPSDILVSIAGTIGRAAIVPSDAPEMNCNQAVAIVRPTKQIDNRFLLHWLNSSHSVRQVTQSQVTGTISNLSLSQLGHLKIPLPPLDEQRRIAGILDQADTLRRKRKETLKKLQELRLSVFTDLFGDASTNSKNWPIGTIGDLANSTQYGTSAKAGETGELPILRMGNITYSGDMDFSDLKYIDLSTKEIEKYTVRDGDILFNRTNSAELVGKTTVFRGSKPYAFAGYLVRLRTNEKADPEYVSAFLNSPYGKATLQGMCKSIIGMANINAKELCSIRVPIPPLALQQQFANRVSELIALSLHYHAHLQQLDALFASLQHRAFRGEL